MKNTYPRLRAALLILLALAFVSCSDFFTDSGDSSNSDGSSGGGTTETTTSTGTLTIVNNSSSDLDFVRWVSSDGTEYYFEPDSVYDAALGKEVGGMNAGSQEILTVKTGSSGIYFYFAAGGNEQKTADLITVVKDAVVTFTITDSTNVALNTLSNSREAVFARRTMYEAK